MVILFIAYKINNNYTYIFQGIGIGIGIILGQEDMVVGRIL